MKIYTKKGDEGNTSLFGGKRVLKSENRIDLYGEIDELNSHIGYLMALVDKTKACRKNIKLLNGIQRALFDLSSKLACESKNWNKYNLPKINPSLIDRMEYAMDSMQSKLPKLSNFILPGGNLISAQAHVCRTICRRVERKLIAFKQKEKKLPELSSNFLNRLSDYFFVLARHYNKKTHTKEQIWKN